MEAPSAHRHGPSGDDILVVEGLTVSFRIGRNRNTALKGVGLRVRRGSIVALVGESGSGKSTLSHALVRLLAPNACIEGGFVSLGDIDLLGLTDRRMRAIRGSRIGFVPQDPMMSLNPTMRIGRQVAEAIVLHLRLSANERAARVVALLESAGLPDAAHLLDRYPHELSGGMQQRVLIAMAFACSPELIIADEPTSALDASVSKRVLDRLERMVRDSGAALLIVTHDLAVAQRRADHVLVMSQGEIVEAGPPGEIFANPGHPYTRRLVGHSLQLRPRRPRAARPLSSAEPDVVVSATDLTKIYRAHPRGTPAVDRLSFKVERGTTFALVGESGSGKSTAVRMILGLESITSGQAIVFGQDVGRMSRTELRALHRRVQVVYQSPYGSLDPRFTVEKIIEEPLRSFGVGDARSRRMRVAALLERVELPATFLSRKPSQLSGGQRQRVAIARALALGPDLVICDEPVSALDASVQAQVLDLLHEIQRESGVTYLFISHDLSVVADIAHTVGVLQAGQLVEVGTPATVFANPRHDYTRTLLDAAFGAASAVQPAA